MTEFVTLNQFSLVLEKIAYDIYEAEAKIRSGEDTEETRDELNEAVASLIDLVECE